MLYVPPNVIRPVVGERGRSVSLVQTPVDVAPGEFERHGASVETIGDADPVVEEYLNSTISTEESDLLKRPRFPGFLHTLARFVMIPPPGKARVVSGGEATFEFELDVKEKVQNACLGFMFNSDKGYRVLGLNSRLELRGVELTAAVRRRYRSREEKMRGAPRLLLIARDAGLHLATVARFPVPTAHFRPHLHLPRQVSHARVRGVHRRCDATTLDGR